MTASQLLVHFFATLLHKLPHVEMLISFRGKVGSLRTHLAEAPV